jgi:hypothetical protein
MSEMSLREGGAARRSFSPLSAKIQRFVLLDLVRNATESIPEGVTGTAANDAVHRFEIAPPLTCLAVAEPGMGSRLEVLLLVAEVDEDQEPGVFAG